MIYNSMLELEDAIKLVIADCLKPEAATQIEIRLILKTLDKIALFIENTEVALENEDDDELIPGFEYQATRRQIEKRFPNWGFYNQCNDISINIADTTVIVGDAIDDIADIICELKLVLWVFENQSSNNAMWHLNFCYEHHWREHLLYLKLYEHELFNER